MEDLFNLYRHYNMLADHYADSRAIDLSIKYKNKADNVMRIIREKEKANEKR